MLKELRIVLKDKSRVSFLLVIDVTLSLLLIFCSVSECFRSQITAASVQDAVEDVVISTANNNYAGVCHGIQEGHSGGCMPYGEGEWEETLDEGNIYTRIDEVLGTRGSGGRYAKFARDSGDVVRFALTDLNVMLRNAPPASFDPGNAQRLKVEAIIRPEVPVRSGRKLLSSVHIALWA